MNVDFLKQKEKDKNKNYQPNGSDTSNICLFNIQAASELVKCPVVLLN
jgi:hypothetical protein